MIHWGWAVISLFVGVVIGLFVMAFLEVSREEKERRK